MDNFSKTLHSIKRFDELKVSSSYYSLYNKMCKHTTELFEQRRKITMDAGLVIGIGFLFLLAYLTSLNFTD
ncbi:hypothetical protein MKY37_00700 [Psychrobacillus sp. FSL K6-2836]|uniref:hypothetical protein n=1 Tax=Psychrobacillus sp. FSL K6-2836 TaxID=2921548 RepID=UPI0030FAEA64